MFDFIEKLTCTILARTESPHPKPIIKSSPPRNSAREGEKQLTAEGTPKGLQPRQKQVQLTSNVLILTYTHLSGYVPQNLSSSATPVKKSSLPVLNLKPSEKIKLLS